jgi:hypothetical protein
MKTSPWLRAFSLGFLLIIVLASAPAFAQTMKAADPYTSVVNSAELEQFRHELMDYFGELQHTMELFSAIPAVRRQLERSGMNPVGTLAEARHQVSEMNLRDLNVAKAVYARFPGWRQSSRTLDSLIKPTLRQSLEMRLSLKGQGISPPLVADNCQDGIDAGITNTDISIAKAVLILAASVMEAFPTDGLTIAARLPSIAATAAGETGVLTVETLKGINDDCNGDAFETAIQQLVTNSKNEIINNDNSNKTAIINNDDSNKTAIINNDNSNKTAIINNDNANLATILASLNQVKGELRDLILRTQIEADLAEVDGATPVALYEIPTASGGYLDLVQTIVTQTIANVLAAGGTVSNAQTFLNKGNTDKAAGKFKSAYDNYRKAYKAAAK